MNLERLKAYWNFEKPYIGATPDEITLFETTHNVQLPADLKVYLFELNGSGEEWDESMNVFYPIAQFQTVQAELGNYRGIPDYSKIVQVLPNHENCFCFANHSIHVLTFAIRLYAKPSEVNEIYIICGSTYELLANSFSEFIDMYLKDPSSIQMNRHCLSYAVVCVITKKFMQ